MMTIISVVVSMVATAYYNAAPPSISIPMPLACAHMPQVERLLHI